MPLKIKTLNVDSVIISIKEKLTKEITRNSKIITGDIINELKANTPVDTGTARDGWHLKNDTRNLHITNDVPYVNILNGGHSEQAPVNFIEKTVLSNRKVKPNGTIVQITYPNN